MKKGNIKSVKPEYPTCSEFKTKKFLNIATAVGIGVSAAAISLDLDAEEKKTTEERKAENPEQKVKDKIVLLAVNLGHKEFKERDKSTKALIFLGEKFKKEKKTTLTAFLKSELEKCKKSKDPEVKDRAKLILIAITPPPPRPPRHNIKGKIVAPGW